ncbi:MAG: M28 family peptidase [Clostridia bacterium]|nr:M28 family peptidase [Clostridia bacterium]
MNKLRIPLSVLMALLSVFCTGVASLCSYADEFYLGDVNMDGAVTAEDARTVLRAAVDLEELAEDAFTYGDYDGDGRITAEDARLTLRTAVELEPLLHVGEYVKPDPPKPPEVTRHSFASDVAKSVSYSDLSDNMHWLVETLGERNWWTGTEYNKVDHIYDRLASYGFSKPNLRWQKVTRGDITGYNVIATIPTAVNDPDIILLCAHYDTARGTGGAVDNSSGAVALLQLAKRFLYLEKDFGAEVRFLFTAGEEQGYYGAYAYVNALSSSEAERHVICLNMDMMGKPNAAYSDTSYYLAVATEPAQSYYYYNARSNVGSDALDEAKEALGYLGEAGYYSPVRAGLHDIVPFRSYGIPALTLSWRRISSADSYGSDYGLASPSIIHQSYDNMHYFDMDSLYNATRLMAYGAALILADHMGL